MTDTKDLLAQALAALDAERLAYTSDLAVLSSQIKDMRTQNDSLTSANVQLQAQLDTANATIASLKAATDPWAAVDKTGATDVTDKVQALINTTPVPAGKYLIDAVKGIKITGAAKADPDAIFVVKPNSSPKYCVFDIGDNASLEGGQILGDRLAHTYVSGTNEWGYGAFLRGDGAKIKGTRISQCTGDGLGVSGNGAVVDSVVSTQNRRQGMSVFACTGLRVYDSEFSWTGALGSNPGTAPMAGVDLEPDKGSVTDAIFERCTFKNNARCGFEAWMRSGIVGGISGELRNCTFDKNINNLWAKDEDGSGPVAIKLTGCNFLSYTAGCHIKADSGSTITVGDGTQANANSFNGGSVLKQGLATKYDIQQPNGGKAVVGWNKYPS